MNELLLILRLHPDYPVSSRQCGRNGGAEIGCEAAGSHRVYGFTARRK